MKSNHPFATLRRTIVGAFITSTLLGVPVFAQQTTLQPVAPNKLLEELQSRSVSQGCKIVARISVDAAKKVGTAACPLPKPTPFNKIACKVGMALQDKRVEDAAVSGVTDSCEWAVKKISEKTIEVSVEVKKEVRESKEEIKAWINFLNTTEGAVWFTNKLGGA